MTTLDEARIRAQNDGTTQITRFRKTLSTVVLSAGGVIAALLVTILVTKAVNSNLDRSVAGGTTTSTTYVAAEELIPGCSTGWAPKTISSDPNNPTQINALGACGVTVRAPGRCWYAKRGKVAGDSATYGPICDQPGKTVRTSVEDIEYIWADGEQFDALVRLYSKPSTAPVVEVRKN